MEFYRPKRKIPLVPILPLIDILMILLIYFAVEYDPKKKREVLQIELALAQDSATTQVVEPAAVLAVAADGSITLDATRVIDGMLVNYLKLFREQYPERKLELEPDKQLPLETFIIVQNALIEAGINPKDVPTRVKIPESALDE
ncbi:biopolymer transporter ExbD [Verrucomicrobiaceae bacterium N1E253]|uniref:Biopolymer transporter ExbD n=1 Tax=Oceaniferula marina TaxID=2748318 RepID=A0A851G924_9BACT|nr:biopolymer transporter ExbD [Oceaniferula marina]NWK54218.1 biopolymer transporter ExbD [Oceaniferula marina]